MKQTGFPVQMPTTAGAMPEVRLAQPGNQRWTPARRAQPMVAQRMSRPVGSTMSGKMGQTEAAIWARGSDITFSILTGLAAVVSGVAIILELGKATPGTRTTIAPRPGMPARTVVSGGEKAKVGWYVTGGAVALIGIINIFASITRAASLQIPVQPNSSARTSS